MDGKFMLTQRSAMQEMAIADIVGCNEHTARYGLVLTPAQARELVQTHERALSENGRVEFGGGVVQKIIMAFCNSPFITQHDYAETLSDLVETFYYFKNETLDELSDDELVECMRDYFNQNCRGSMELLQNRELEALARRIRAGIGHSAFGRLLDDNDDTLAEED